MTDLLLAVVVIGAVIAFGALISVGNERQRQAIDALHQAYKQWAVQDLRLKRGTVSSQTRIEDITAWLTRTTSLALGRKTNVIDYQVYESPVTTVEIHEVEGVATLICALESPEALIPRLKRKRSALRTEIRSSPLFRISKKTPALELSILNAGSMFDVELPVAWSTLTGESTELGTLWVYILP
jgi:hypothetical protein